MSDEARDTLLRNGLVLILVGLLTGVAVPVFTNPRLALSAHIAGVLNGILLMVLGLAWSHVGPVAGRARLTVRLLLYSMYSVFAANLLGAAFGTSRMTPFAGAGYSASAWQEMLVGFLLVTAAVAVIVAVIFMLHATVVAQRTAAGPRP